MIALHFDQISFTISGQKREDNILPMLIQSDNLSLRRCTVLICCHEELKQNEWLMYQGYAFCCIVENCPNLSKFQKISLYVFSKVTSSYQLKSLQSLLIVIY